MRIVNLKFRVVVERLEKKNINSKLFGELGLKHRIT